MWHTLWAYTRSKHSLVIFCILWIFLLIGSVVERYKDQGYLFSSSQFLVSIYSCNWSFRTSVSLLPLELCGTQTSFYWCLFYFIQLVSIPSHSWNVSVRLWTYYIYMFYYAINLTLVWKVKTPLEMGLPKDLVSA